jgi:hypothetical protein
MVYISSSDDVDFAFICRGVSLNGSWVFFAYALPPHFVHSPHLADSATVYVVDRGQTAPSPPLNLT